MIRFRLKGVEYQLTRPVVESRLARHSPEPGRTHLVEVNGEWFPVKQAFEVALGVPRSTFTSQTARRHLAALGFPVGGEPLDNVIPLVPPPPSWIIPTPGPPLTGDWHTEARVQAKLVGWLIAEDWSVISTADTATREHGVDVVAGRDGVTFGFEVKGYPGTKYADPRRSHETKSTRPSTQAGHWYAAAVLAAMRLRQKEPTWVSAIALPHFPRYQSLFGETNRSLGKAGIQLWWVAENGAVWRDQT